MPARSVPSNLLAALDGYDGYADPTPPLGLDPDALSAADWQRELSAAIDRLGGWHSQLSAADAEWVRHGLAHLRRGDGSLADRLGRCLTPGGPYFVPGVGWRFWAAAARDTDPGRLPLWCPDVLAGCERFGVAADRTSADLAGSVAAVGSVYDAVRDARPGVTAARLDGFFRAVGRATGREPGSGEPDLPRRDAAIREALRAIRAETPLRSRKLALPADTTALLCVVAEAAGESPTVPASAGNWFDRLAAVESVEDLGDGWLTGDGLWLAAGVLHRRQPKRFPVWTAAVSAGQKWLDDAAVPGLCPSQSYRLLANQIAVLRERYRVHPLEAAELLARLGARPTPLTRRRFGGFCRDTFRFLGELADHNSADWMAAGRDRYRHAVRAPLVELCDALAERYVRPVLGGEYGWVLETDARPGRALSSVCKNDFGQSGPYQPVLWATFYRRPASKKTAAQLFARVAADGLAVGFQLSRSARDDGRRFRQNVQAHGLLLFEALTATGGAGLRFAGGIDAPGTVLGSAADLRQWAANKDLVAGVRLTPAEAVARTDDLVGEAVLTFDRLVPLFAAAVMDDPTPVLRRRAGRPGGGFDRAAFRAATLLGDHWLGRALDLLAAKRQLVLQGVPGTGKTHVARALARHLTGDRPELVETVQFHPAYSYEEFVEGIRPKATDAGLAYPVEPGVLVRAAERAGRHPADTHVLLIDELNRGNLPRVFGEMLYLLEYRDQGVTLPYSKAPFRLPPNLFLIATLNPADRSVTPLDQATRRRFAFLDMPPDAAVLSRWLAAHPPADPDPEFGGRLVNWFERLNGRLSQDFGPERQVGHAYWLREQMTATVVRTVWEHEVRPALADLFARHPERLDRLAPPGVAVTEPRRRRAPVGGFA